jgi:hypothetical protein
MRYFMKRRVRPLFLGYACATREVAWEPLRPNAKSGIKLTCGAAVPTLQAQREPAASPADQQSIAIQIP